MSGKEKIRAAILLEESDLVHTYVYRGTNCVPKNEWQDPCATIHSLSFGKTMISGLVYDNAFSSSRLNVCTNVVGSVPLTHMIERLYGYVLSIDHAQYRAQWEQGVNLMFVPPLTHVLDVLGSGEGFCPRRKLLHCSASELAVLENVNGLDRCAEREYAPFLMVSWADYRHIKKKHKNLLIK